MEGRHIKPVAQVNKAAHCVIVRRYVVYRSNDDESAVFPGVRVTHDHVGKQVEIAKFMGLMHDAMYIWESTQIACCFFLLDCFEFFMI